MRYPIAHQLLVAGTEDFCDVYEGQVAIYTTLDIPDRLTSQTERLELMIDYQACNTGHCRPPNQLTLRGRIPVAGTMQPVQNINRDLFPAQ